MTEKNESLIEKSINQPRFGCVMFDLVDVDNTLKPMPGSGWASIEGKSAFRIKNLEDLSSDIKWLTNLNQQTLWKTGVVSQSKLKHSAYLRTDVGQIMKEIGLNPPKVPIATVCEKISEIFNKVMKMAQEFYDIQSFSQKDLNTEVRDSIIEKDNNISDFVDEALTRSYQDLVICEKNIKDLPSFITLRRPRYYHAKQILETAVPVWNQDWDFVAPDDMPKSNEKKIEFLMAQKRPFIAKVHIQEFDYPTQISIDLSKLLNLGEAIGEGGKTKDRNWVSQPELLYLSKFAKLTIDAAFIAKGYQSFDDKINVPYLGELSDFSYSLGLLSEVLWTGLAARSLNPKTKGRYLVSPRACWLKAADRFMTLTSAMMMASAGFKVISYAYGAVTVAVEDHHISKLIEIAPHAGLNVPQYIIEKHRELIFMS